PPSRARPRCSAPWPSSAWPSSGRCASSTRRTCEETRLMLGFILRMHYLGVVLLGLAVGLAVDALLGRSLPDYEIRGGRAGNRLRALKAGSLALLQPVMRIFTSYAAKRNWPVMRARIEIWLRQGDHPMGLVPSEVLGLCGLTCVSLGLLIGTQFNVVM